MKYRTRSLTSNGSDRAVKFVSNGKVILYSSTYFVALWLMFRLVKFAHPSVKGTVIFPPNKASGSPVPGLMNAVTYLSDGNNKTQLIKVANTYKFYTKRFRLVLRAGSHSFMIKAASTKVPGNPAFYILLCAS